MICVFKGPLGTETICNGDSGGPLMVSCPKHILNRLTIFTNFILNSINIFLNKNLHFFLIIIGFRQKH